jgi:hypothetical protein
MVKYGDIVICVDEEDVHYLQTGMVTDEKVAETFCITYSDKTVVEYAGWRIPNNFQKIITDGIRE